MLDADDLALADRRRDVQHRDAAVSDVFACARVRPIMMEISRLPTGSLAVVRRVHSAAFMRAVVPCPVPLRVLGVLVRNVSPDPKRDVGQSLGVFSVSRLRMSSLISP